MRNRLVNTEADSIDSYDGHVIHARAGVHAELEAMFRATIPRPARVLDVGAGAGAFSARLAEAGYEVVACDLDATQWSVASVPFVHADLNGDFGPDVGGPFDAACCIEVIEHVENPWHLLRQLASVVRPAGRLLLSTPNVTSFLSRLSFLRTGRPHQFDERDLEYGHINPVTSFEVRLIARSTGWRLVQERPTGYLPVFDLHRPTPRSVLYNVARGLVYVLSGPGKDGWCRAFLLERVDDSATVAG
jgi:SAM-dependent methyltransferase